MAERYYTIAGSGDGGSRLVHTLNLSGMRIRRPRPACISPAPRQTMQRPTGSVTSSGKILNLHTVAVTAEHAPLGNIMRVRKEAYRHICIQRHKLNWQQRTPSPKRRTAAAVDARVSVVAPHLKLARQPSTDPV